MRRHSEINLSGQRATGYIIGNHFPPTLVEFSVVAGRAIFEGDIVLGPAVGLQREQEDPVGTVILRPPALWPGGLIPYTVEDGTSPRCIAAAIEHWTKRTPIRFSRRKQETNYLCFKQEEACSSYVGMRGGQQDITIGAEATVGNVIHQIGHAVGLWHEQDRRDRDDYLLIVSENIHPNYLAEFEHRITDGDDIGPYDYDSVMHFGETHFSANELPTLRARGGQAIGKREGLSSGDIAAVRHLYGKS